MTITQLNLSHFLIIGPKLSTVNNSCPGQNFQNQVRLTNNASLNQRGSFSVEVLRRYGKDRPTKDDLEIALFSSKESFWLTARSMILYCCHMLLWHRINHFKLVQRKHQKRQTLTIFSV